MRDSQFVHQWCLPKKPFECYNGPSFSTIYCYGIQQICYLQSHQILCTKIDILGSPALTTLTVSDPPLWSQQAFTKLRPSKGKGLGTLQHLPVSWTVTAPEFLSPIATVMFLLPAKSHMQKANWWDIILKDAHSSGVDTSCHILSIALCSVLGFHQSQNCFLQRLNCATEVQTQKHHSLKECPKNRHTHVIQL